MGAECGAQQQAVLAVDGKLPCPRNVSPVGDQRRHDRVGTLSQAGRRLQAVLERSTGHGAACGHTVLQHHAFEFGHNVPIMANGVAQYDLRLNAPRKIRVKADLEPFAAANTRNGNRGEFIRKLDANVGQAEVRIALPSRFTVYCATRTKQNNQCCQ